MKKLLSFATVVTLLAPVALQAQSPFNGTWKVDLSTAQMPKKPDVYLLQNGRYECRTCVPVISVKADGQDQAVTGHPYYDSVAVSVVDAQTVALTNKKAGKVVATMRTTISPDGKSGTYEFSDSSATNAEPVTGKGTTTRVAAGPAGAHAISGSWRTESMNTVSDNGLIFTCEVEGSTFAMTTPTGQSYTANLNGATAAYKGDPGIDGVSIRISGTRMALERDFRNGKVISVSLLEVARDGKTMKISVKDKLHDSSSSYVAVKQ